MKLLLALCLGLVALATCQESEEFLVIEEGTSGNDLNPDEVDKLQEDGTAAKYLKKLQGARNIGSLDDASVNEAPPGYRAATGPMFDNDNADNNQLKDTATESRVARSVFGTPTRLYHCPHTTYLLRWFPLFSGSTLTNICFVPWANRQAITYARCTQPRCRLTNGLGRCRPSCYIRRHMLVVCFNFQQQTWSWRWVVRALPQACRCSTC